MSSSKLSNESRRALTLARRYLRFGTRSRAELRAYLRDRNVPDAASDTLIAEWSRRGLLDDQACAKLWATTLADRGYAWGSVREQLLAKGLDEALIAQVLTPLEAGADDAARARALAQARVARRTNVQRAGRSREHRHRTRVAQLLASRGFDSDLIDRVLAESFEPISD